MKRTILKSISIAIICALSAVFAASSPQAHAEQVTASPTGDVQAQNLWLKLQMKRMGWNLRDISKTIGNPLSNAQNADLADGFVNITTNAKGIIPEGLNAKEKALYEEMMDQSIETAQLMAEAFRKNDQVKAKRMMAQLNKGEKEGHKEFGVGDEGIVMSGQQEYKDAMKTMGIDLKLIQGQVNDPSANADSINLADEFLKNAISCKTYIPDTITKLPATEQPARIDLLNKFNADCINLGQKLLAALKAGNNAAASQLLNDLGKNKKDSHAEFK